METITDYPNYSITNEGKVINNKTGKILKAQLNRDGYFLVKLYNENGWKQKYIHRLAGEHFLERVEGKTEIDHINRNKQNNHISNLRWADRSEQQINKGDYKKNSNLPKNISIVNQYYQIDIQRNKKKTDKKIQ